MWKWYNESVDFGAWSGYEWYLNCMYNNFAWKIRDFIEEVECDKYARNFNVQPLIDFAITQGLTDKNIDSVYAEYINYIIRTSDDVPEDNFHLC